MTARDMVSLATPPKNEAAPMRAKAPGSNQAQYGEVWTPTTATARHPIRRPNNPPISLKKMS